MSWLHSTVRQAALGVVEQKCSSGVLFGSAVLMNAPRDSFKFSVSKIEREDVFSLTDFGFVSGPVRAASPSIFWFRRHAANYT
jgi:hypothetical protein